MRKFALIGQKLGHSHSKQIHESFGLYDYSLLEVEPENLPAALADESYSGFNVTIPYKREVLRYCAALSPEAREIGSVNTLVRTESGLVGHNTDILGFESLLRRGGISLSGRHIAILGSGGTSLTAQCAARRAGARELTVVARGEVPPCDSAEVLINTTPVGMYPKAAAMLTDPADFARLEAVVDVIYNPLRTRLVLRAAELGIPAVGGLYMLYAQAAAACELFTKKAPLSGFGRLQGGLESLVLTGMPGAGKSTVGALIAAELGRELLDTDELVVARAGMSIPEIFAKHGEAGFRELERELVAECSQRGGLVIATGGGAVLDRENYVNLASNGRLYHLRRELDLLATEGRPLSAGPEALLRLEKERLPVYEKRSSLTVFNSSAPETAARLILEDFYASTDN